MDDYNFSYKSFFEKAIRYFRLLAYKTLLSAGSKSAKALDIAILILAIIIFAPLLMTILFISLGFGFASWIPSIGYSGGFLLSAAAVLIIALLFCVWAFNKVKGLKFEIYQQILNLIKTGHYKKHKTNIENENTPTSVSYTDLSSVSSTPPPPPISHSSKSE